MRRPPITLVCVALVAAATVVLRAATYVDDFTVTSTTDILSYTPTAGDHAWTRPINTGSGSTWSAVNGANDVLSVSARDAIISLITVEPGSGWTPASAEYDVSTTIIGEAASGDDPFCLIGRFTGTDLSTGEYYYACIRPASNAVDAVIGKRVGGTTTDLVTGDCGAVSTDVLTFEVRDATKRLLIDGVECVSTSDNAHTSAGTVGAACGTVTATANEDCNASWDVDDFTLTDAAVGGGPPGCKNGLLLLGAGC